MLEEKRYRIEKIEKYDEIIENEKSNIKNRILLFASSVLLLLNAVPIAEVHPIISGVCKVTGGAISLSEIFLLTSGIMMRTEYKNKRDKLVELENIINEQNSLDYSDTGRSGR